MKFLILGLALVSTNSFAWGPTGHRVVGEIAEGKLNPSTLKKVKEILKGKSLAGVANWPDEIRSEPEKYHDTFKWHYTDFPDEMKSLDESKSSGLLTTSIQNQINILKDKKSTADQKEAALKFLVHLVGDLHMPLHVGNGKDRGGNWCHITFHGEKMNLHHLWDEAMIDFTKLSFTEISRLIQEGVTGDEIKSIQSGTVADWTIESRALRLEVYPAEVKASKKKTDYYNYCNKDGVSKDMKPALAWEYSYKFYPKLERQLLKGGLRLAQILNSEL